MKEGYICIVDDEPLTRKSLYEILRYEGYKVSCSDSGIDALKLIEKEHPDIVITDLKMPQIDGIELLKRIKEMDNDIAVVLMTAYGSIDTAVEAMRKGAFDYITKPILDSEIKIVIERIFEQKNIFQEYKCLKKQLANVTRKNFQCIISEHPTMQNIYNLIETIAPTNASVLIQGESGTGKRLIARAIYNCDTNRHNRQFVEVSCGALPETLLESELFGHVKGAFTGAIKDRQGRFEAADGGTLFLDEIDTFSPKLQVKLLRVLQEGEFERVGDTPTLKTNVRIISATNQNLRKLIKEGLFREDLYYRLNVIPIDVPSLRHRLSDLPLLVDHFMEKCSHKLKKNRADVEADVIDIFRGYEWPGNIRELENIIERAVILSKDSRITREDLPDFLKEVKFNHHKSFNLEKKNYFSLKDALRASEKEIIENVLREHKGNRKKAAETLGINRTSLYNKMKEYGLLKDISDGSEPLIVNKPKFCVSKAVST